MSGIPISITEFPITSRFRFSRCASFVLCTSCLCVNTAQVHVVGVGRLNGIVVLGHVVLPLFVKCSRKLILLNIIDIACVHR